MISAFFRWARRLYRWVEALAAHPQALWALAAISFVEAIFFPIPPDVLLIPMAVTRPNRALLFGGVCLIASIVGGVVGYALGASMMGTVGNAIVEFYGLQTEVHRITGWYQSYDAWIVAIAGFTPLPYKLFSLTSGAAGVNIVVFVIASVVGRGARFFLIAGLIAIFGERAAAWIDRNFNLLTVLLVLLILGVIVWGSLL